MASESAIRMLTESVTGLRSAIDRLAATREDDPNGVHFDGRNVTLPPDYWPPALPTHLEDIPGFVELYNAWRRNHGLACPDEGALIAIRGITQPPR